MASVTSDASCDLDGPNATEIRHSYLMMTPADFSAAPFNGDDQNLLQGVGSELDMAELDFADRNIAELDAF